MMKTDHIVLRFQTCSWEGSVTTGSSQANLHCHESYLTQTTSRFHELNFSCTHHLVQILEFWNSPWDFWITVRVSTIGTCFYLTHQLSKSTVWILRLWMPAVSPKFLLAWSSDLITRGLGQLPGKFNINLETAFSCSWLITSQAILLSEPLSVCCEASESHSSN